MALKAFWPGATLLPPHASVHARLMAAAQAHASGKHHCRILAPMRALQRPWYMILLVGTILAVIGYLLGNS